jgi:hypothetical protein
MVWRHCGRQYARAKRPYTRQPEGYSNDKQLSAFSYQLSATAEPEYGIEPPILQVMADS